ASQSQFQRGIGCSISRISASGISTLRGSSNVRGEDCQSAVLSVWLLLFVEFQALAVSSHFKPCDCTVWGYVFWMVQRHPLVALSFLELARFGIRRRQRIQLPASHPIG